MSNDHNLPQSPAVCNFFRPAQFEAAHPNIFDRPGRLDNWLRYRDGNGLLASGAVFSKGKLIFIDGEKFAEWLTQGEGEQFFPTPSMKSGVAL